jgi:hypothetical protein
MRARGGPVYDSIDDVPDARARAAPTPRDVGNAKGDDATMCRAIKTLHNFEPPASDEEIRASALQFVRKLSGFTRPSRANDAVFVLVGAPGLGREVVPQEALHRVLGGADLEVGLRLRDDRPEHLESGHDEPLVLGGIESLNREAEEPRLDRGGGGVDAERDGVHAGDGEDPKAADSLGPESHGVLLAGRSGPKVRRPASGRWSRWRGRSATLCAYTTQRGGRMAAAAIRGASRSASATTTRS